MTDKIDYPGWEGRQVAINKAEIGKLTYQTLNDGKIETRTFQGNRAERHRFIKDNKLKRKVNNG